MTGFSEEYYNEFYRSRSGLRRPGNKPYLYAYWKRFLKRKQKGGKLLDVGCGLGYFTRIMEPLYQTYGIDVSQHAIDHAKTITHHSNLAVAGAVPLKFENDFFDIVSAFDVIEHLEEPDKFVAEVWRVLKPGGIFVMSTPNPESLGARTKQQDKNAARAWWVADCDWHGRRDQSHIAIRPSRRWRELLQANRFNVVKQGTDFLWDTPYVRGIPERLQWVILVGLTWILVWAGGVYPWRIGENYACAARKKSG